MKVEQQYADSHGQTEAAFAFCRLLGFELMPRLKNIHNQELYRPEASNSDVYLNLQAVPEANCGHCATPMTRMLNRVLRSIAPQTPT